MTNRSKLMAAALAGLMTLPPGMLATKATSRTSAIAQMSGDEKALHALNRLTFGPRPGDVDTVEKTGLKKWIDLQLHPASIPENPTLESKLAPLETLRMTPGELAYKYPPIQIVRQMIQGRQPWPSDPETRVMIEGEIKLYKRLLNGVQGNTAGAQGGRGQFDPAAYEKALASLSADQRQTLNSGTPERKVALIASLSLQQQYDVMSTMRPGQRRQMFVVAPPELQRRMTKFGGPLGVLNQDMAQGKIYRAVYSNRQLQEVLTDFWYNHFNVSMDKAATRYLAASYERDAIRPFVLSKFKDLLTATAESPAMLFYLDNYQSVGPNAPQDNRNPKRAKRGLNENYGRELMELHTLGVDGGYTQKDVTEVARCFTGWTIREPQRGATFEFNERLHDRGEKRVLGVTIPAGGGVEDGYKVIDILAHHPSTAKFISRSLATRFVSDNPPEELITRMAATFTKTNGDLRDVMKTMLESPEFWAQDAYRAKIKSPFEMMASALRSTDADVEFAQSLVGQMNQLGEPLFRKLEPTGYSNRGADWMNSAALLGRMNFALALTNNKIPGVKVPPATTTDPDTVARGILMTNLTPDSRKVVENGIQQGPALIEGLKAAKASAAAKPQTMENESEAPNDGAEMEAMNAPQHTPEASGPVAPWHGVTPEFIAGLTLGSPDFQRR